MTMGHGFCPGHGSSVIGHVYPGDAGCAGSSDDVAKLPPDVAISSSPELLSSFLEPAGGFLMGNGEVFFETIRLDVNFRAGLVEGL